MKEVKLTQIVKCAGCAAKLPPAFLSEAIHGIKWPSNEKIIQDMSGNEDCGVYALNKTEALVQTTDFFTPVVDDPFLFGQIAVTNALSDIYAMGAIPLSALNLVCYPEDLGVDILHEILRGGAYKAGEANCPIIGGHSVSAPELKYGVAVTGQGLIDKIRYNNGARSGDLVILTKGLGTGILNTAIKRGQLSKENYNRLVESMIRLNNDAGALLKDFDIGGVTDVTGFSLMGHGMELAKASNIKLKFYASQLPILPGTIEAAEEGHITRGDKSNRKYTEAFTEIGRVNNTIQQICFDPQTSGGLLITVKPSDAQKLLSSLQKFYPQTSMIGECRPLEKGQSPLVSLNK
tara:strand:- start:247 stop:1290 length:1044 start_codon:yes stop_codon:yes gene_type:complete